MQVYLEHMAGWDVDPTREAVKFLVATSKFFPSIAELADVYDAHRPVAYLVAVPELEAGERWTWDDQLKAQEVLSELAGKWNREHRHAEPESIGAVLEEGSG